MAILAPVYVLCVRSQDMTVTLTVPTDTTGWTMTATLRDYLGGTPIASKTVGSGIVNTPGASSTVVITFTAADLTVAPGVRVWGIERDNAGFVYPIVDPSGFLIMDNAGGAYPTLTNPSEYLVQQQGSETVSDADAKFITQTLASVEAEFHHLIGRKLTYKAGQVFYLDGTGTPDVVIPRTPVNSVVSVYLDTGAWYGSVANSFAAETLQVAGEDYVLVPDSPDGDGLSYAGILRRIGGVWPYQMRRPVGRLSYARGDMPGCIKVTADCGYVLVPGDIKQAIFDGATQLRMNSLHGRPLNSESGEGYSYSLGSLGDDLLRVGSFAAAVRRYSGAKSFIG